MSTALASWTCPQCQRRVPRREPLCHCGFPQTHAAASASPMPAPGAPVGGADGLRRGSSLLVAVLGACALGALVYLTARPRDQGPSSGSPTLPGHLRAEVGYPALPAVPAIKARRARRADVTSPGAARDGTRSATALARPPAPTATEQEWARATELLDLPLRKIAADTSVLELAYRPFAEACLQSARGAVSMLEEGRATTDSHWLASLKTVALRPEITIREGGATVGCEGARQRLVARADALRSELAAVETLARTNAVLAGHWRALLARYGLDVWDRY